MKRTVSLLLAFVLCVGLAAPSFAAEDNSQKAKKYGIEFTDEEISTVLTGVFDELELTDAAREQVAVGFYCTATDQTWMTNEELWLYSASLYKLPLMMIFEQRIDAGEFDRDEKFGGTTIEYIEERVLRYSNNDFARMVQANLFFDGPEFRECAKQFSDMADEDYDESYINNSHFNVRYVLDVMCRLYNEQDKYPTVIDQLLLANPGEYFRTDLEGKYDIAQKYGAYTGVRHTAGIIYTPNPIVLVVLTGKTGHGEQIIAAVADAFTEFALKIDGRIEQAEADEKAEQERIAAEEEAMRLEKERLEREQAEKAAAEAEQQAIAEQQQAQEHFTASVTAAVAGCTAFALAFLIIAICRRKKKAGKH